MSSLTQLGTGVLTVRANFTAAATNTALVTASANQRIAVTHFLVTADNANTVDVSVVIGFGLTTTPTTTKVVGAHPGIPAGGGFQSGTGSAVIGEGARGEDLRITSEVPTTGSIDVVVTYILIDG